MSEGRNFWRGSLVRLRPIEQKDIDEPPQEPDTENDRFMGSIDPPLSPEIDREQFRELARQSGKDDYLFLLIENQDGETVGFIHSHDCVRRNGTFKYAVGIKRQYWGRGYGRAAVMIFLRYFFRELRYQKCTTPVYAFNERSIRFHESIGFRFEGRLRNMVYTNGEYFDELYFGLTNAEWDQIDPPLVLKRCAASAEKEPA
ncbi:MAG TPA: GNAT family protein [Roseiflexaceae bacterium]|nr:GNAT family protein [Roseiflexaceae bacterium]